MARSPRTARRRPDPPGKDAMVHKPPHPRAPRRLHRPVGQKGWKLPPNAVFVGKRDPSSVPPKDHAPPGYRFTFGRMYANPWDWRDFEGDPDPRLSAKQKYHDYLVQYPELVLEVRRELSARDLVCWCRLDQPCHADVLLTVANELWLSGQADCECRECRVKRQTEFEQEAEERERQAKRQRRADQRVKWKRKLFRLFRR